ncbi:MAG: magnesium transporter [Gammaproteobacteria bacterium]|nr:magnesium transporter [Gammaproteobacteria bacterium]MDH5613473.1 magnesium transporter [Gammaproteobacteria bacterium]
MSETNETEQPQDLVSPFVKVLEEGNTVQLGTMLEDLYPAEIAHILESLTRNQRETVWQQVEADKHGEVLILVNDAVRDGLMQDMHPQELVAATEGLETDDLADILLDLPDAVISEVLQSMDEQDRKRLEAVLSYDEDSAGGLMNTDTITVRADVSLDVVLRYLRRHTEVPAMTDSLIVVNRDDKYVGTIALTDLLINDLQLKVSDILRQDREAIPATMSVRDVANLFEHRDLVSAPVVDSDNKLLGRITIDDVVDVIREEADHSFMSMAGLNEEDDMFAPVIKSTRRRSIWLGVNLITAIAASWVIGLFDASIEKLVALAVLMPIVASMGGIAGSQTLTLVIRGMALGTIGESNIQRIIIKETLVGIMNGMIWALVIAAVAIFWFDNLDIGFIIAAAILITLIIAALSGAIIPLVLRKMGADPALAGSVILTTVTDVIGFLTFLGLATLFLI